MFCSREERNGTMFLSWVFCFKDLTFQKYFLQILDYICISNSNTDLQQFFISVPPKQKSTADDEAGRQEFRSKYLLT
jgi:hypothetical protein